MLGSWFHVKISFQQSSITFSLVNLFIIFFSCFLSLLLVGAVVWKIKQRYDNYRCESTGCVVERAFVGWMSLFAVEL